MAHPNPAFREQNEKDMAAIRQRYEQQVAQRTSPTEGPWGEGIQQPKMRPGLEAELRSVGNDISFRNSELSEIADRLQKFAELCMGPSPVCESQTVNRDPVPTERSGFCQGLRADLQRQALIMQRVQDALARIGV